MIIEALVISIIIGFLRKGKLSNLAQIPLRHIYLFLIPFLLFSAIIAITLKQDNQNLITYAKIGYIVQYLILLTAIGLNFHIREMLVAALGTILNFIAVAANGGQMPVSYKALEIAGIPELLDHYAVRHCFITSETKLVWLTDIIPVPLGTKYMSQVISIGDLIVAIGVFILIQRYMVSLPKISKKECM